MFVHIQIYPNRGRYGAGSGFPCWTSLIVIVGACYALSHKLVVIKLFFIGSEPHFCNGIHSPPRIRTERKYKLKHKSGGLSSLNQSFW